MPAHMKGNTLFKPSIIKTQSNKVPRGRKVCITVAPSPLCRQPYFTHPAGARKLHSHVGMAGWPTMHTVHNLWVSTQSFQLMVEGNGSLKFDNSCLWLYYVFQDLVLL